MPGPLSSPSGSVASNSSVPGTKSNTTVRLAYAVAPDALVATIVSTDVPPVSGTVTANDPSPPAVVVRVVVALFLSVLDAPTTTVLPGAVVPATSTESPTADSSAGALTVSVVCPWAWST